MTKPKSAPRPVRDRIAASLRLLEGTEFLPVPRTSATFAARVFSFVDASGDCWEWTGARDPKGYGVVGRGPRDSGKMQAYCAVWQLLVGPIPEGMQYDHLCRNHSCVNPDHGEIVTLEENLRRGYGLSALCSKRSTCGKGHPLDGTKKGRNGRLHRYCLTCAREARKEPRTRCKNGHDFTPETVSIGKNGGRYCRICMASRRPRAALGFATESPRRPSPHSRPTQGSWAASRLPRGGR